MRLFNKRADCASGASGPGPGAVTPGEEGPGRPRGRGLAPRPGSPPLPRVCPAVTRVRVLATRPGTGRREGLDPLAQCPRPQPCTPLSGSLAQVPCAGEEAPGCDGGDPGVPSVGPPPASSVSQGAVRGGRAPPGRAATPHKAALLGAARAPATLGALRVPRPLSLWVSPPFLPRPGQGGPQPGASLQLPRGKGTQCPQRGPRVPTVARAPAAWASPGGSAGCARAAEGAGWGLGVYSPPPPRHRGAALGEGGRDGDQAKPVGTWPQAPPLLGAGRGGAGGVLS